LIHPNLIHVASIMHIASINGLRIHFLPWPLDRFHQCVACTFPPVAAHEHELKCLVFYVGRASSAELHCAIAEAEKTLRFAIFRMQDCTYSFLQPCADSKTAGSRHDFGSDSLRFPASVCVSHAFSSSCLQDRIRVRSPQLNLRLSITIIPP